MQERVKTSFIPKASLSVEHETPQGNPISLVNIIATALLIASVLAAAGVFVFDRYTLQAISAKQDSLDKDRTAFDPATIKRLAQLDARVAAAKKLLGNHLSVSELFSELEGRTLQSIRFSDFKYDTASGKTALSMSGEAASYNAIAVQSDAFSKSAIIQDPIFSNVNITPKGTIGFDFSALIDTAQMKYTGAGNTVSGGASSGTTPSP